MLLDNLEMVNYMVLFKCMVRWLLILMHTVQAALWMVSPFLAGSKMENQQVKFIFSIVGSFFREDYPIYTYF